MAKKMAEELTGAGEQPKTKAQIIREAIEADSKAMPKAIADRLTAEGLSVTANEVSQAKYLMKVAKKKRGPKAASRRAAKAEAVSVSAAAPAGDMVSVAALQKAKKLIQELGGVKEAKQALAALAQLLD